MIKRILLLLICMTLSNYLFAIQTPIGLWQTYDLKHQTRDVIKLIQSQNQLIGIIAKSTKPSLIGKKIIWGLTSNGTQWENGYVLNVDDNKIYRCQLKLSQDNKTLYFSPYMGLALFGVTLQWHRV